ncbi:MAG: ABC transporter substrate-binding protein [Mobilicoccus sp.]|nr:ABC transporter substrate-binding protein [Mobilicoccus sp.]
MSAPPSRPLSRRLFLGGALAGIGVSALAACGSGGGAPATAAGSGGDGASAAELRLGYFATVTHAVPLAMWGSGTAQRHLGDTRLSEQVFTAGPTAIESLLAGALDAAYLGPSPAINAHIQTRGRALRVVSGAAQNGAAFVVRDGITGPEDLRGKVFATPQLGGTQDVALRTYLVEHGLTTDTTGGDDVTIVAQANAQTLDLFRSGDIDGAWLPEPWVSRLVLDAGATVLVDEKELWPNQAFPTTLLVVSQEYLDAYPATVRALLEAHVETVGTIEADRPAAIELVNGEIARHVGAPLEDAVMERAFGEVKLGWDPLASAMTQLGQDAVTAGIAQQAPDLTGLLDLTILDEVLSAAGESAVDDGGLGPA